MFRNNFGLVNHRFQLDDEESSRQDFEEASRSFPLSVKAELDVNDFWRKMLKAFKEQLIIDDLKTIYLRSKETDGTKSSFCFLCSIVTSKYI